MTDIKELNPSTGFLVPILSSTMNYSSCIKEIHQHLNHIHDDQQLKYMLKNLEFFIFYIILPGCLWPSG
jgi:hypothetical protein